MAIRLLIDGYNLLHFAGLAQKNRRPGHFERARDQLLLRLKASLSEEELAHTTIIFDAQYADGQERLPTNYHGMEIQFSPNGRQADDLIEDFLQKENQPQFVRVVSSDRRLRAAARASKSQYVKSDRFLEELDERLHSERQRTGTAPLRTHPTKSGKAPLEDIDWEQEFGVIDVEEIEKTELGLKSESAPPEAAPLKPSRAQRKDSRSVPAARPQVGRSQPARSPAAPPSSSTGSGSSENDDSAPTIPIARGPQKKRLVPGRPDAPPAPTDVTEVEPFPDFADLPFWEKRVAEMLSDEEQRKDGRRPI